MQQTLIKNSFSHFHSNLIPTILFWFKKPSTNRKITLILIILSFIASIITYLVFSNYEKLLKWNRSLRFSISVCTLANMIKI